MKYLNNYKLFENVQSRTIPKYIQLDIIDMALELRDNDMNVSFQWWPPYEEGKIPDYFPTDSNNAYISIQKWVNGKGGLDIPSFELKDFIDRVSNYLSDKGYKVNPTYSKRGYSERIPYDVDNDELNAPTYNIELIKKSDPLIEKKKEKIKKPKRKAKVNPYIIPYGLFNSGIIGGNNITNSSIGDNYGSSNESKIDNIVKNLLDEYNGGKPFFNALDLEIKKNPDMILELVKDLSNDWIASSGGFGDLVYEMYEKGEIKCKGIVIFNGKMCTKNKGVSCWYPHDVDLDNKEFTYIDDSLFSGKTYQNIDNYLKQEHSSKISKISVVYDGSKELNPIVKSLFRYY